MNLDLTKDEQANVRGALQFLRRRCGGWAPLGKILGFKEGSLSHFARGKKVSPIVAFRISRLAKVSMDDLLGGMFPAQGTCPYCGHVQENGGADDEA